MKPRNPETNKYDYGHALLIAGSYGKMGAALLATKACLRIGAGLVTCHVPRQGVPILQIGVPEVMASIDPHEEHLSLLPQNLERYNAIGIGPGIGTHPDSATVLEQLLRQAQQPLVLDADALNLTARYNLIPILPHNTIITPHAKEYERLFGNADPATIAKQHGLVIVMKGHHSRILGPDGQQHTNTTGNAGMATAGSGDVLTGIITGLLAQGYTPFEAAKEGVYLHGKSGDLAVQKQSESSLIASDIIENLKYATL